MILGDLDMAAFRGMAGVRLQRLAPVSVAVGANNAGKSSVLEAAALVLRPFDPGQWIQVARQRDVDMALVDGLWSLFPTGTALEVDDGPKQTKPLRLVAEVDGARRELSASGLASASVLSDAGNGVDFRIEAVADGKRADMIFRRGEQTPFTNGVTHYRCFTVTPATHRSTRLLAEHLSKAVDTGDKPLALELLRLFDPEVEGIDVSVSREMEHVRVTHRTRGIVDLASFGDGMRRTVALALALVRSKGGLLLVDELEAGIHPRILPDVLARLFAAAQKADVQILATTHSLEAIDALIAAVQGAPDRAAAFYLQRQERGHAVRRYDQSELAELRDMGLDLR